MGRLDPDYEFLHDDAIEAEGRREVRRRIEARMAALLPGFVTHPELAHALWTWRWVPLVDLALASEVRELHPVDQPGLVIAGPAEADTPPELVLAAGTTLRVVGEVRDGTVAHSWASYYELAIDNGPLTGRVVSIFGRVRHLGLHPAAIAAAMIFPANWVAGVPLTDLAAERRRELEAIATNQPRPAEQRITRVVEHLPWLAQFATPRRLTMSTVWEEVTESVRTGGPPIPARIRLGVDTRAGERGSLLGGAGAAPTVVPPGTTLPAGTTLAYVRLSFGIESWCYTGEPLAPVFAVEVGPWADHQVGFYPMFLDDQAVDEALAIEEMSSASYGLET